MSAFEENFLLNAEERVRHRAWIEALDEREAARSELEQAINAKQRAERRFSMASDAHDDARVLYNDALSAWARVDPLTDERYREAKKRLRMLEAEKRRNDGRIADAAADQENP